MSTLHAPLTRSAIESCRIACAAIVLALFVACSTQPDSATKITEAEQPPVTEANAAAKETEPEAEPPRKSKALSIDGYKRDAARRLYFRNTSYLFEGAPPPRLKSVVVLSIKVDSNGVPLRVTVVRSNGIRDLEQRAIKSVHDSAPLPVPHVAIVQRGSVEYVETWLFRDDGRFQIRSLAKVQASIDR